MYPNNIYLDNDIEDMLPPHLKPVKKNNYYSLDCPACKRCGELFIYEHSKTAICNRRSKCGYSANIRDLPGALDPRPFGYASYFPKISKEKVPVLTEFERDKIFRPALGKIHPRAFDYLKDRIPRSDVQGLFDRKIIGAPYYAQGLTQGFTGPTLAKMEYNLLTPLYSIESDLIVTAQARFPSAREPTFKGIKVLSFSNCPYGKSGVTFGSIKDTIEMVDKHSLENGIEEPTIILAEGDVDFLTLRASGYDNVIGVPGAGQAVKVVQYLKDIKWRGNLVVSLDGDKAGEESYQKAAKAAIGSDVTIVNGRPPNNLDLNDVYNKWGKEEFHRLIKTAKPKAKNRKIEWAKIVNDAHRKYLKKNGIYASPKIMPLIVGDRYRTVIKGTGGKDSPLSPIARAINCKQVKELEMIYKDGEYAEAGSLKMRVAETPVCEHCSSVQWNLCISKWIRENWPKYLQFLLLPFPEGDLEAALKLKKEICGMLQVPKFLAERNDEVYGQSLFIMIDVMKSRLLVVTDHARSANDYVAATLRSLGNLQKIKREQLMKDHLLPAHLSYARYVTAKGLDFEHTVITDPILTRKFERYYNRKALPWPKTKEIREAVREERKRQAELLKEVMDIKEPELDENSYKLYVTFRERRNVLKKVIGVSWKRISFDNIVRSDIYNMKMNFDPRDPLSGNFLDSDHNAPKPVKEIINDFFWLQYGHPVKAESKHEIPEIMFNQKNDPREQLPGESFDDACKRLKKRIEYMNRDEYEAMIIDFAEHGYNPRHCPFLPGCVPLTYLVGYVKEHGEKWDEEDAKIHAARMAASTVAASTDPPDPPPF